MNLLSGKNVVVTGGSEGIGKEIALKLAESGANVLITYRTQHSKAEKVKKLVEKMGRQCFVYQMDVQNESDIHELSSYTKAVFGKVDVLINNAGVYTYNTALETSSEQWDLNVNVNLKGTFLVSRIFAKDFFVPQNKGRIVNMSSFVGITPVPFLVAYNVAKAGIIHLTKQLAMEWGKYNIEVVSVSPGYVETEAMLAAIERGDADGPSILRNSPAGRLAKPGEVANLFTYLASDKASYISGSNISIDGAYSTGIRFTKLVENEIVVE
ncbi:SDR family NAD(P)-dependent oxidoreductase [Neobacillus sp. NPDC093182]|uniref:SDR family NAD(P)-dependent oxidoreductase n=1 Tax=Neobacillus sp. NPDC093182 TaxID=3364297 RepID=UPI0037F3DCDA